MLRATWRSLLGRKLRLVMSAFAIVLGVSFVSGSLIFTRMMGSTFDGIMNGTVADVNVRPEGTAPLGSGDRSSASLTPQQVARIAAVPGVESAQGVVTVSDAYVLGRDGKILSTQGAPAIGGNVVDHPAFDHQPGMVVQRGRTPQRDGEVALDPRSLDKGGYHLGDTVTIASSGARPLMRAKVVGTVVWGARKGTAGTSYAMVDARTAQKQWMGGHDAWMSAWVTARPGQDVGALVTRVKAVAPAGFEVVSGKDLAKRTQDIVSQGLGFVTTFLLVFAAISLIVGSFLIVNTFSILVAQRSRELALLRALGASRVQVRRSVLLEAFVTGLVGSTLGLFLGLGIAALISRLFGALGLDLGSATPGLTLQAVVASYLVGMLVTMVAAYLPARRASRVPPVAAMTGEAMTGAEGLGRRLVVGLGATAVGVTVLLTGLYWSGAPQRMAWVGLGALVTLLGVAFSSPVLGRPVLWLLGRTYRALFGQVGGLAELNASRNPRRTAATASALMIGLTLVSAMSVLGDSAKVSTRSGIEEALRGDYLYVNPTFRPFSASVADQAAHVPGVAAVHRFRQTPVQRDGKRDVLEAIGPGDFDKILSQRVVSGSPSDFRDGTMMVDRAKADEHGWHVGSTVTYTLGGRPLPLRVVLVYDVVKGSGGGAATTLGTLARAGVPPADSQVSVDLAHGVDKVQARSRLEAVVKDVPMVKLQDQREVADEQSQGINQILYLIYGLLGLAVVIAVLGIVNTLALSVIERTREIGLLRAIGLRRGQLGRMIRLESVAIALLGSVLGLAMGLLFGYAIVSALADDGLSLHVPWLQLAAFLVVAALVGVLAALWPAHRAARMDVLRAIQTE